MSMPMRGRVAIRGIFMAAIAALYTTSVRAQSTADTGPAPRVDRLTIAGAQAVSAAEVRANIFTEATRCRGFLLRPFCLISNSTLWKEVERLDTLEVRRDELRIRVHYFRRGYREAQVASSILRRGADAVEVRFDIVEGPATTVTTLDVVGFGEALDSADIALADPPEVGEPLDLIRLDSAALRLRERLDAAGYIDAEVIDTAVVDRATETAVARIEIEPHARATLEEVEIVGTENVADGIIRTALDVRDGDVLTSDRLYGSQRNLYQSNLFRMARVRVPPQPDSAKLLVVEVDEAPPRSVNGGVGVSTIDFVQIEGGFTHYDLWGGAQLLDVQATVGNLLANQLEGTSGFVGIAPSGFFEGDEGPFLRPTWQASVTLSQPSFRSSYRNTLSGSVFSHRRIVPGIAVDRGVGASASFTRKLDPRSPLSATYRYEISRVEAGEVYYCINFGVCEPSLIAALRDGQTLSPAAISFFADRSDDPLAPTEGFHIRVDAEHASALTLSNFRYNRATAEYAHFFPIGEGRVLAGRVRGGWVRGLGSSGPALGLPDELELVHPRKRFYAGGSRSVRGFGESQLGPRILSIGAGVLTAEEDEGGAGCSAAQLEDGSCDPSAVPSDQFVPRPLGGERLLEANVEYRFPLFGAIGGAVFVDAGWLGGGELDASAESAVTPGFGFRYASPIGPVRIDLGIRPQGSDELAVVTEIVAADGERRIIRLDEPKLFDPLEGRSGIGKLLSRLTLHFSIGQAF
jgi:outer membrane protein assembly factor BamA